MKNFFKSKANALILAFVLFSSSIFAQATCTAVSQSYFGDLRVTEWQCSNGSHSLVVSLNVNGTWVPLGEVQI